MKSFFVSGLAPMILIAACSSGSAGNTTAQSGQNDQVSANVLAGAWVSPSSINGAPKEVLLVYFDGTYTWYTNDNAGNFTRETGNVTAVVQNRGENYVVFDGSVNGTPSQRFYNYEFNTGPELYGWNLNGADLMFGKYQQGLDDHPFMRANDWCNIDDDCAHQYAAGTAVNCRAADHTCASNNAPSTDEY